MDERALVDKALEGDADATRALVKLLMPVVQARVARALARRRGGSGRDVKQEVEDLAQEVFAALFAEDGRALRAWDAARGLSLASFCGLVAEREASSILRSGRRSPWTEAATELEDLERQLGAEGDVEIRVASREELARVLDGLRAQLSPKGLDLFHRLVVEEQEPSRVCAETGLGADAVYAWKSRLVKLVRKLAAEARGSDPNVATTKKSVSEAPRPRRSASEET